MKKFKTRRLGLKAISGALVGGAVMATVTVGISGCDHDVRARSVSYGSSYYQPYDYYYYPSSRIYFNIVTGLYYYPDGDRWRQIRTLPPRYYLDSRDRVNIRIKSKDRPYLMHHEHRVKYAPRTKYKRDYHRNQTERNYNQSRYKEYQWKRK